MLLVLVRHGYAGHKDPSSRIDRRRPLTKRGVRQAEHLVRVIQPLKPTRILSSPFNRCVDSMIPLAAATGLDIERNPALTPASPPKALSLIRQLSEAKSTTRVVVCTHGEVMGVVLSSLADADNVELERRPPGLKGCVWVLTFRRSKLIDARYIAP